jgi:hypothetical protein
VRQKVRQGQACARPYLAQQGKQNPDNLSRNGGAVREKWEGMWGLDQMKITETTGKL